MLRSFLVMTAAAPTESVLMLASFMNVVCTVPDTETLMLSPEKATLRVPTVPSVEGG